MTIATRTPLPSLGLVLTALLGQPGVALAQVGGTTDIITGVVIGADSQPMADVTIEAVSVRSTSSQQPTADSLSLYIADIGRPPYQLRRSAMGPLRMIRRYAPAVAKVAALMVVPSVPIFAQEGTGVAAGDLRAQYVTQLENMESKFVELADAMGGDTYSWRPMEGVRSVSEVYMLIVAENYFVPNSWGAEAPEGMTIDGSMFGAMAEITDKASVVEHLRKSFVHCKEAVANLTDEQLHEEIQFFGAERPVHEAIFLIVGDMHEHLGQAIAYARMNQVVPPWTARAQANR